MYNSHKKMAQYTFIGYKSLFGIVPIMKEHEPIVDIVLVLRYAEHFVKIFQVILLISNNLQYFEPFQGATCHL